MDRLAETCEEMQRHASRTKRESILAAYLKTLNGRDLRIAAQFLSGGPMSRPSANQSLFEEDEKQALKIGRSVLREALRLATGWDKETLKVCHAQVGDTGETIGLLMRGLSAEEPLSLLDADTLFQELFQASTTAKRTEILVAAFRKYRPLTLKYLVKIITRSLRIDPSTWRPCATLDVVVTAAQPGVGYTCAVRNGNGFVNIGKACSALTDLENNELIRRLRSVTLEKFGRAMLVKPEIVVEVAFEGVQRSARHKGGYALRSPRIARWRKDKRPEECDGLDRVEALYRASLE